MDVYINRIVLSSTCEVFCVPPSARTDARDTYYGFTRDSTLNHQGTTTDVQGKRKLTTPVNSCKLNTTQRCPIIAVTATADLGFEALDDLTQYVCYRNTASRNLISDIRYWM